MGGAAAILVFEHTWVKPLRDAVFAAGGELAESIRVPGPVVSEVLAEIEALENEENSHAPQKWPPRPLARRPRLVTTSWRNWPSWPT